MSRSSAVNQASGRRFAVPHRDRQPRSRRRRRLDPWPACAGSRRCGGPIGPRSRGCRRGAVRPARAARAAAAPGHRADDDEHGADEPARLGPRRWRDGPGRRGRPALDGLARGVVRRRRPLRLPCAALACIGGRAAVTTRAANGGVGDVRQDVPTTSPHVCAAQRPVEVEQEPMGEDGVGDRADVVRQDERSPVEERPRLAAR